MRGEVVPGQESQRNWSEAALVEELKKFIRERRDIVFLTAVALLISYGFALTSFSLSIDEEVHLIRDQTAAWLPQGRFTIALIKTVMGDRWPLPFLNLTFSLGLVWVSTILWTFLFNRYSRGRLAGSPSLIVFAVFYATVPSNAYYLTFNTYNIEVSFGYILAALSALFSCRWAIDGAPARWAAFSALCAMLAVGTYQSFAVVCAVGVLVALLLDQIGDERTVAGGYTWGICVRSVALVAPIMVGVACAQLFNTLFVSRSAYTENFFNWGKLDNDFIIGWLGRYVRDVLLGNTFPGGWVVLPTVAAAALSPLWFRRHFVITRSCILPLILIVLLVSPFVLSFALGTPVPNRAQQVLPLAFGSVWLVMSAALDRRRTSDMLFGAIAAIFAISNAQANTRLFFSEYMTYQYDQMRAEQIIAQLTAQGWSGVPVPLVVVGELASRPEQRFLIYSETFGGSFFEWDKGARAPIFMEILGYPFLSPSQEQSAQGAREAASMPVWPARGSVVIRNGLAIVKLGQP